MHPHLCGILDTMKIKLCECGNEIPQQTKPNGQPRWNKYCSEDCKKKYWIYNTAPKLCSCGNAITPKKTPNGSITWNKYCSDECIKNYSNKNKSKIVYCPCGNEAEHKLTPKGKYKWNKYCSTGCRKLYYSRTIKPKICACGGDIPHKIQPSGYPYWTKYCSDECRKTYGNYPKGRTKSATCLGCGLEFTRPASYPTVMKYCSNECSHKEIKSVRDKFVLELGDKAIVFHSMWEMRFIVACDKYNIPWRRYDGDLIKTSIGNYRPDFIVGADEKIVEVKGRFDNEDKIKTEKAKEIFGDKYLLLFEEDLKKFEETGELA